ncbi:hypothetical protein FHS42_002706 [Streptomyces zagrosensis]|uniref:Uncharacterized protein n=1 Tax=Streptomyces zagrosensis TaxID=1042984 RepID=A0A7W9Q8N5_9ACTN|nr:hypothetical protein [Streptomyces zagrosensis]
MMHRPGGAPVNDAMAWGTQLPDPETVDPTVLTALLARHGWRRRGGAAGHYARWTSPGDAGGGTNLLVPENRAFFDSADLLGQALLALSRSAVPSARAVLVGLAVPSDEIRWWRDVPQGPDDGSKVAAWGAREQLRSAARAMLVAGALATHGRAGYYGARHRRDAEQGVERVWVGAAPGRAGAHRLCPGGRGQGTGHHAAVCAARRP